jgi:hypothetical protein
MVGKKVAYSTGGMRFPVSVEDVKLGYGKVFYYIRNDLGHGKWTSEDCIEVLVSEKARTAFGFVKEIAKEFIMP